MSTEKKSKLSESECEKSRQQTFNIACLLRDLADDVEHCPHSYEDWLETLDQLSFLAEQIEGIGQSLEKIAIHFMRINK